MKRILLQLSIGLVLLLFDQSSALAQCGEQSLTSGAYSPGDDFGVSVAADGPWVVVGSRLDMNVGSASIFENISGMWQLNTDVVASDGAPEDRFGASSAISGDRVVVGSPLNDDQGSNSGAAYVFERTMTGWLEVAKLLPPDGTTGDRFGNPVAIQGDVICVGVPNDDDLGADSGSAYIYEHDPSLGWLFVNKVTASNGSTSASFGVSVSLNNGNLLVGSTARASYYFERSGSSWVEQQRLEPLDQENSFGGAVALGDDHLVIGAALDDDHAPDGGAAYVFERNGSLWAQAQELYASDASTEDRFGSQVSISGELIAVGASYRDSPTQPDRGAVYLFNYTPSGWSESAILTASNGTSQDRFGTRVWADGLNVVVGAVRAGSGGAAYIYDSSLSCSDCNGNLVDDSVDIASGTSSDCNQNGVPDECDLGTGTSPDCNSDGVPDECGPIDCNLNGIPDECDIDDGTSRDCQGDGVPDECEIGFASVYCFCDVGSPCGNDDPDAGCANATGSGAAVFSCGSPSVSADDLFLSAEGVLSNVSGLFYMGGGNGNQQPFGDGERCVFATPGQGIKRFRPTNGGASGVITLGPVVSIAEMRFGPGIIVPGQTWNFQCWYRDPIGPCGSGYSTSNAVSVTFAP